MQLERMLCWEAVDANDPMTVAAGQLYERTLAVEERIPWEWIGRALGKREEPGAGVRRRHLLLAAPEGRAADPESLAGFAYGTFIPGYGGYLCYMGVAEWARRHGVGTRLMEQFFRVMAVDAGSMGEALPFVVWESHKPQPHDGEAEWKLWNARVRLFDRVGGSWIEGIEFQSPSWAEESRASVPLQLFVKPMDVPASSFQGEQLRQIVAGLHEQVYRNQPGDALYDATLPPHCAPRLRPAKAAGRNHAERHRLLSGCS